jgi:farnesyl-diphosphate farnesyltransferase
MDMKQEREDALLTGVLKAVSRSFYLSLRLLPEPMRAGAGIGYLLARASDTIADTNGVSVVSRLAALEQYGAAAAAGGDWQADAEMVAKCLPGERVLLDRVAEVFALMNGLPAEEKKLVVDVLGTIISGQMLDLQRCGAGKEMQLADDAALWDYCDRVAGCVGDFWTKLGYVTMGEKFSREPLELMCAAGISLGRGLQLVNILRDVPEDVERGRFYLPGSYGVSNEELRGVMSRWMDEARICLEDGLVYAREVRDRRARAASVLPAMLGLDTIDLLTQADWHGLTQRVKVGRWHVLRTFVEAWVYR